MPRQIYETAADESREATVAYKVALHFRVAVKKSETLSVNDWEMVSHGGATFALLEVKWRLDYSWADLIRLKTYMLSADKWKRLTSLAESRDLKLCLAVSDKYGEIHCATFSPPWPTFEIKMGGRTDRGDPKDKELCVYIPTEHFKHSVKVADITDLDSLEQILIAGMALIKDMRQKLKS